MKVSIIIPVYNAAEYVEMCLDSCFIQSYVDIQVVAVNDGSTDSSGELLDRYAAREIRLKVVHTFNQGVTLARKTGIDVACGEWLFFLDSDDFIEPDSIRLLLQKAEKESADLVIGDFNYLDINHNIIRRQYNKLKYGSDSVGVLLSAFRFESTANICGRLVKKAVFDQIELPNSKIKIGEDVICGLQLIAKAGQIALLNKPIYNYIQYPNSTIHSQNPIKVASMLSYIGWILDYFPKKYLTLQNDVDNFALNEYFAYLMYGGLWSCKFDLLSVYMRADKSTLPLKIKIIFEVYRLKVSLGNLLMYLIRYYKRRLK